jgi:hypothetical protein
MGTRVARFFSAQNTKTGNNIPNYHEIYQLPIKYNKRLSNGPSVHKIYHHSSIARPSKVYPNLDFGLRTNHLATLMGTCWNSLSTLAPEHPTKNPIADNTANVGSFIANVSEPGSFNRGQGCQRVFF